ncbi:MAG: Trk system potassium transporter TrkA [Lachnospiraceae bacterium]|nr:Trk system potassium transporter TrkA [Lachnospiraceae bacterium]
MKIIIVGCGKVGLTLTEQLVSEGHDITLIDSDNESLEKAVALFDVQGICGNGTSFMTLQEAGIKDADLLIAVTDEDEKNLLCCLIAKKAGNPGTIARVRNPEYNREISFIKEELGLSMALNPELTCAKEIEGIIKNPEAKDVDSFFNGLSDIMRLELPTGSKLDGETLARIREVTGCNKVLVCAIRRGQEIIIPDGRTKLLGKDEIYVVLPPKEKAKFLKVIGIKEKEIQSVIIAGGGSISYYLAERLLRLGIKVKIIEQNKEKATKLSELLPTALIIHGDASDKQLLLEEGIKNMDAFISLTNFDEENILISLYANKVSDAKIITKINKITIREAIDELPVGIITSPKDTTIEHILRYVRSKEAAKGSNVENLYRLLDNKAEALEFHVTEDSDATNITLFDLKLKKNLIICNIHRDNEVIVPSGQDSIKKGDTVVVVTTNLGLKSLDDILDK